MTCQEYARSVVFVSTYKMRRLEDTTDAKITRMHEFYSLEELFDLKEFMVNYKLDEDVCWTQIDMQTRADYFATNGREFPMVIEHILDLYDKYVKKT